MKLWQKKKYIPKDNGFCYKFTGEVVNFRFKTKICKWYKYLGVQNINTEYEGENYLTKIPVYCCTFCHVTTLDDILLNEKIKCCGMYMTKINDALIRSQDRIKIDNLYPKFRKNNVNKAIKISKD